MIYIDPREGSKKLLVDFEGDCEEMMLDGGDCAFFGRGPDNVEWFVGIEYKTLPDICQSMKNGRFTGTQLPRMMNLYDCCFLLIEGIGVLGHDGQFMMRQGKMSTSMGLYYNAFDNFLTSVSVHSALAGKPCIVKHSVSYRETVQIIRDTYAWFQKSWEQHTSISRPDRTKIERVSYELEVLTVKPEDPDYSKYFLRKSLFQLDRLGWIPAGAIADRFGTYEALMAATAKEMEIPDKIGKTVAERLYKAIHGYVDPAIAAKKVRKKKEAVQCVTD